ncbi:allantoate amidohydrolase [Zavarzinia sp. CC-PAN008]|uniref:allantoate amidohydrolase n=1 Tax=Zavarzinia sp. CC-PAN008 TaxID=3243332 RepID=UPI003F745312
MIDDEALGAELLARADELAAISAGPGLTRLYLTPEHAAANALAAGWMVKAGMAVRTDAVGTLIGRYEGTTPGAPALLLGSHLDTVRDAGKYDGMLGVLSAIACVDALNRAGRRLPCAVEVAAFADEEGTRFGCGLIGSCAIAGTLDPALLARTDAAGTSMGQAMAAFGLDPAAIGRAARAPGEILAFAEVHIEQGPVLEARGLALGVVTAIQGATRLAVTVTGVAGHAGTVPMGLRRDALVAAARMVLEVEAAAQSEPGLVATVGRLAVSPDAVNVVPGQVRFTVDARCGVDARRQALVADIAARLNAVAGECGVGLDVVTTHEEAAADCDPALQALMAQAAADEGAASMALPSGAGHDGMAIVALAPIAMLFVRCRGGVSHNPAESITAADAGLATRVFGRFIDLFAQGLETGHGA